MTPKQELIAAAWALALVVDDLAKRGALMVAKSSPTAQQDAAELNHAVAVFRLKMAAVELDAADPASAIPS